MFKKYVDNTRIKTPLVHNITNYVTVNDCANILLACGASPIMADDANEVEDMTSATVAAVSGMGLCGELAYEKMQKEKSGTSSYRTYLIDFMSNIDGEMLQGGMKVESR